jgi:hypothetical protein
MRISLFFTVFVVGLAGCRHTTAFVSGDELIKKDANSAQCNDLEQRGEAVVLKGSRDLAPSATGGTIADGTYVLTSSTLYTKARPHGSTLLDMGKTTMVVSGPIAQLVRTDVYDRERRSTVKRVSEGTVTRLQTVCSVRNVSQAGPAETSSTSYTATPDSFQFITPGPAGTVVSTYKRL